MLDYGKLKATLCQCRMVDSVFSYTLLVLLAMVEENPEQIALAYAQIPKDQRSKIEPEVTKKVKAINSYFHNVKFKGLSKTAAIWGTIINALKVEGEASNVTDRQKEVFKFGEGEVLYFFQMLLNDVALCREINRACNQPTADMRALGAIVMVEVLDERLLKGLVQFFTAEGPSEDNSFPPEVLEAIDPNHVGMPSSSKFQGPTRDQDF